MKRYLAQLRPVRGTTMSDGSQCRTKLCNSHDEALMWLDRAENEEFAAGRSPGRANIIDLR